MLGLYKFYYDCGRMGDLSGLFVAFIDEVDRLNGREVYFGEVLGKHSDIAITFDKDDTSIELLSHDQEKISWLVEINDGDGTISGFNPLDYLEIEDED